MANAAEVFGKAQTNPIVLTQALKEWAIAISALRSGSQILLLRKGGIRDPRQPFSEIPRRAALFPTYEHQVPHYLKQPVEIASPDVNAPIVIDTWAHITHGFLLSSEAEVMALLPFHIWTAEFVTERLKWRSHQPLQALLLRAYSLQQPVVLGRSPSHAGCRSWIHLETPIFTQNSMPALSEQDYQTHLKALEDAIQSVNDDFKLKPFERN
jgi:hypothetical protein